MASSRNRGRVFSHSPNKNDNNNPNLALAPEVLHLINYVTVICELLSILPIKAGGQRNKTINKPRNLFLLFYEMI